MGCGPTENTEQIKEPGPQGLNQSKNFIQDGPDSKPKDPFMIHGKKVTPEEVKKKEEELVQ